jgi:hypothetical protein
MMVVADFPSERLRGLLAFVTRVSDRLKIHEEG